MFYISHSITFLFFFSCFIWFFCQIVHFIRALFVSVKFSCVLSVMSFFFRVRSRIFICSLFRIKCNKTVFVLSDFFRPKSSLLFLIFFLFYQSSSSIISAILWLLYCLSSRKLLDFCCSHQNKLFNFTREDSMSLFFECKHLLGQTKNHSQFLSQVSLNIFLPVLLKSNFQHIFFHSSGSSSVKWLMTIDENKKKMILLHFRFVSTSTSMACIECSTNIAEHIACIECTTTWCSCQFIVAGNCIVAVWFVKWVWTWPSWWERFVTNTG